MNIHSEMRRLVPRRLWLLFALLGVAACGDDADPFMLPDTGASPGASVTPDAGQSSAGPVMDAGSSADAARPQEAGAQDAQPDANTGKPAADAGGTPGLDAGGTVADTGVQPAVDASMANDAMPAVIPTPVTAPAVWGVGIGVTDLAAAVKFYTEVMKMTVEKQGVQRDDRTETVLYASEAMRGARLVLMSFTDQRNTRKITTKLVWQASNPGSVNTAASKHPDYVSRLGLGIYQFDGPSTYIQEVGSIFDSGGGSIKVPYLIAMGFSVSDIAASRRLYTGLGMEESPTGTFSVTDATGRGSITEYTLKWSMGSGLVLQDWSPERNSKDNPVKVVMFVPDAQAAADKVMAGGGSIAQPAQRTPVYDNRLLIVAKDRDGYILELVQ